jgi:hypothetical protein
LWSVFARARGVEGTSVSVRYVNKLLKQTKHSMNDNFFYFRRETTVLSESLNSCVILNIALKHSLSNY